jgi:prevent-host-death family protein
MTVNSIGIREAKSDLSKILKKVKNGREVIITDRGNPVAKIVPIISENVLLADRIRRLERLGLMDPLPKKSLKRLPEPLPAPEGIGQKYLQEDRNA